jgi:DNA-binding MarR family transcriptional regulator
MLDLDSFLPYRLNVLAKRISRELARRYADQFGIGVAEWRVLAILGRDSPLSSNDIGERTQMDKAKVSRAVARLVDAGRICRAPHPDDQRLLRLSLTDSGQELYGQIAPLALDWQQQWLARLNPDDHVMLQSVLAQLEAGLDAVAGATALQPDKSDPD